MLRIAVTTQPHHVDLTLVGELDLEAVAALRDAVRREVTDETRTVHLDLSAITFIDCIGLSSVLWCERHTLLHGARLTLSSASPCVTRLLALTAMSWTRPTPRLVETTPPT